ncbi:NAD(P)/FAD-dependent oxidoreductase [Marinicella rhabdoformis]|uniref:NAD(P)/FAD-dependent oxidoreductase n=1 Tax=Marinicella rhabdoformis TaxID=2580566 RepID=UPI0012AEDEAA|nr:NAD(P)/FAD-dependent oxidoreductase [Marinicella rhabdoformis]
MKFYDVIVLGAGAAGLMCALKAGQKGLSVLVLEKANKPGKKILMSGGGRCNFTNQYATHENYLSKNPHFCKSAMSQYTVWDFIAMVEKHNIPYHEKELGQLFCDKSSKDILNMLLDECDRAAVKLMTSCEVQTVDFMADQAVLLKTEVGDFETRNLVVATGGLSIPKMGGSGFGYQLAEQLGLEVLPKRAGLVPFVFSDQHKDLFASLSGTSVLASLTANGQTFTHQVLFTHRGLSGPAVLQISSYWDVGQSLSIDWMPEVDVADALIEAKKQNGNMSLLNWLSQFWPNKLAEAWLAHECPSMTRFTLQQLSKRQCSDLADSINRCQLKPAGTEGYRTAEVTLGGVNTNALSSKTMAVNNQPNVYFIGEVVDVTGHLGGFNFQWAWASAHAAASSLS